MLVSTKGKFKSYGKNLLVSPYPHTTQFSKINRELSLSLTLKGAGRGLLVVFCFGVFFETLSN